MYTDITLKCKDCGADFVFTAGEQEFYAEKGFTNQPQRCKACRDAKKNAGKSGRTFYEATCAGCGGIARVPFEPKEDRPVYCSNRMKNAVDRAKRRNERLEELADEDIPDSSPTPEELVIGRESADEITRCMRSLLSPLELGCIEGVILGMPYSEIAEKLSVSAKSVDNAVTRARAKLKLVFPRL